LKNVQKIDLGLTGYDELFANDEERKVNKLPRIFDIPISEIDDFPDHPFKVKIDEDMDQLVQSIKERGIITPVTLRPKEDGRYEIVSGHRRKKACEIAGLDTVKAEVREMSRDEAIILMVESNLQRSTILPSEKAFSYKMRLEAMKRQAGRPTQDNYSPVGNNSLGTKSSEIMADEVGESRNTIFRYIRLTELISPLLDLVDEGRIAFRPAVELSYLKKEEQEDLLEEISYADATPSLAQAIKMKKFSQEGKLSNEVIESIMSEEKPNQKEKIRIKYEDARRFIPDSVPYNKTGEYIMKALEYYHRVQERQKDRGEAR
jgi:ParB family chromosome partitioning protein